MRYVFLYLLLINALAFVLMLADKQKARKNRWRISERTLMTTALLGGGVGALIGMYTFRHKTRHLKFTVGIPAILIAQAVLAVLLLLKIYA